MCGLGMGRARGGAPPGGGGRSGVKGEVARMLVRGRREGIRLLRRQWRSMWEVRRVGLGYPCHDGRLGRRYGWDVTTVVGTVCIPIDEGDHIAVSVSNSSLCVGLGDSVENPHPPHTRTRDSPSGSTQSSKRPRESPAKKIDSCRLKGRIEESSNRAEQVRMVS